jgi:hypothetical protein
MTAGKRHGKALARDLASDAGVDHAAVDGDDVVQYP